MITCQIDGKIATLTINRPKVNAINGELVNQLQTNLDDLITEKRINGIILTGIPGFFSAGLDVLELFPLNRGEILNFWTRFNRLLITLFTCPKLTFSAISGHSPAGGTVLADTAVTRGAQVRYPPRIEVSRHLVRSYRGFEIMIMRYRLMPCWGMDPLS